MTEIMYHRRDILAGNKMKRKVAECRKFTNYVTTANYVTTGEVVRSVNDIYFVLKV